MTIATPTRVSPPGTTYYYRVRATNAVGRFGQLDHRQCDTTFAANQDDVTQLSSLNWTSATTATARSRKSQTINGNTITLRGTTYTNGIGTHAVSTIIYNLGGAVQQLSSATSASMTKSNGKGGAVDFQVIGDGKVLFDSGVLTNGSADRSINVNVTGVQTLTLVATNGVSDSIDYDHADWAGARLIS